MSTFIASMNNLSVLFPDFSFTPNSLVQFLFAKYDITAIVITVVAGQQGSKLHLQLPLKKKKHKNTCRVN